MPPIPVVRTTIRPDHLSSPALPRKKFFTWHDPGIGRTGAELGDSGSGFKVRLLAEMADPVTHEHIEELVGTSRGSVQDTLSGKGIEGGLDGGGGADTVR